MQLEIPEYAEVLFEPARYKVFHGGRGGAKSWAFAIALLLIGMNRKISVLCARELQVSISDSVHKLLSNIITSQPGMAAFYEVQNKNIYGKNGTEFSFKGLKHNANEIKSYEGVDYCWVEEAQAVSDKSWETLIPTIRKDDSEIWIGFNPKNPTDPTWKRFVEKPRRNSVVREVNWRDNPFFPDVLEQERLELFETDPEAYEHIWEGKFDTRYSGSVYAKNVEDIRKIGRLSSKVKHDPNYPVYTTFDLGFGDATAIIFYQVGFGEVFIIDYYESNMKDIKHYAEVLYGKKILIEERENETGEVSKWSFDGDLEGHEHRQAYDYHALYLPHDSKYRVLAAGGRSIMQQMSIFSFKCFYIESTNDRNRHEAAWGTIPKCWINDELCVDLISAMMHYHFEYDEDRKTFKQHPVHDWSSHACSSFELLSRVWQDKNITIKDINKKKIENNFHRLRRENNMVQEDPYRMKKR